MADTIAAPSRPAAGADIHDPPFSPVMQAVVATMRTAPHREWTGQEIGAQGKIPAVSLRPALHSLHSRRWVQSRWCDGPTAPQQRYWLVGDGLGLAS